MNDGIYIDEISNKIMDDYVFNVDINEYCKELTKKINYSLINNNDYYFNTYHDSFGKFSDFRPGDKLYISSRDFIEKTEVSGYVINVLGYVKDVYDGFLCFYTYVNKSSKILGLPEEGYWDNINIRVCSNNPDMSKTIYESQIDRDKKYIIDNLIEEYRKTIPVDRIPGHYHQEFTYFKNSFLNKDEEEYIVSYKYPLKADLSTANYIFITDSNANIIKEVYKPEIKDYNSHYKIFGILDIDNDGLYELLIESGNYEYTGFEVWKLDPNGNFEVLARGFGSGV